MDVGLLDRDGAANWMRVHRLAFTVGGKPAPAGYQLATMAELRERFFPDLSEEQLLPPSEPLPV